MRSIKVTENKDIKINIRLTSEMDEFITQYSEILNCSKSEAIRKIIKTYMYKGVIENEHFKTTINN